MANFNIDYLVVAGGGGAWMGGGGAGGLLTNVGGTALSLNTATPYNVTVGGGGAGAATYSGTSVNGSNSIFDSLTSIGGGFGGQNFGPAGATGGSGGGGAPFASTNPGPGGLTTGTGLGNNGGASATYASANGGFYGAGGGGGAGALGGNGTVSSPTLTGGNGGNGLQNNITGTNTYYAGGGGGGVHGDISSYTSGAGGSGGGGNGAIQPSSSGGAAGSNAIANTGGGGGGGASYQTIGGFAGGTGGSGIVILRYPTADVASYTATGLTPTETTVGTDTVLSFTTVGTGTITFTSSTPTRISSALVDFNSGTEDGLKLPSGDDANQPTGVQGMIRNNTDSGMSFYNGSDWISLEATTPPLPTVTLTNSWRAWDTASFVNGGTSCTDVTGGLVLGPYSSGSPGAFFYGSYSNTAGNKYWVMNGTGAHARRAGFTRPTEFSVSYWGNKPNNPGFNSERGIWSFNALGANCIRLARRNNANTQSLRIYSGNSAIATFADGINLNTWYNITLTFSANTVKTYVGVQGGSATTLVNETTIGGTFPTGVSNASNGTGFWIATNSGYTDWLTDSWSGLNIYDGVARQAEIDTIVSNGYQQ